MSEAHVWDRLAGRYDSIARLFDASYGQVRERLARDLPAGGRVLELAAGTGQFTAALAIQADQLLATDISPEMVARLRERVRETQLQNVDCAVMSAYELDASDGTFDGVFCANALRPRRARAIDLGRGLRGGCCRAAARALPAWLRRRSLGDTMSHGHDHAGHDHGGPTPERALWVAVILNAAFLILEAAVGFWTNSLALLSDAGHMVSDVGALAGAMLHLLSDALGSVAAIVSAIAVGYFGAKLADPVASLVIALLILVGSWPLLRDTVRILLQRAPAGLDVQAAQAAVLKHPAVESVNDFHVWALDDGQPVLSAVLTVAVKDLIAATRVGDELRATLKEHFGVEHSTFECRHRNSDSIANYQTKPEEAP